MLQAQPECGGADGEDAEQDQAIDATDAALQGIWYNGEAITVHEDRTDRVGERDAREDGSQQLLRAWVSRLTWPALMYSWVA